MRAFLIAVGILAWLMALAVLLIFAESGGALTAIAAGVFAALAVMSLGCERVIRLLEEIRDERRVIAPRVDSFSQPGTMASRSVAVP